LRRRAQHLSAVLLATVSVALPRLGAGERSLCAQTPTVSSTARSTQSSNADSTARANSTASADPTQYVGQYRGTSNPDQVNAVYLDGGVLYEESERRERQRLLPDAKSADSFQIAAFQEHILFLGDASGAISGLKFVLDRDGSTLLEERRFSTVGARLNHFRQYMRQEAMLPMRDGVRLHTVILRPADLHDASPSGWPFLLARTPYGVDEFDSLSVNQDKPELAASGYIFVYQDIRGRYKSEGNFVMNRPIVAHNNKNDVDETTDTRDTIDWLLKNVPGNNGCVGVFGLSYDGFLAMMAGIDAHPAVKAISPQAPMTDVWMGDDFFHNGAFRQGYGFDYVQQMEAQKTDARIDLKQDAYDFFMRHINFADATSTVPRMKELHTVKAFLSQPAYTAIWQSMAVEDHLTKVEVPTLEVGGYWDQEDMWGTQAEYSALKKHDDQHEVFLVLGPWNHGGWQGSGRLLGSEFGRLDFGEPTGNEFRKRYEAPFFEKYLKDRPGFDLTDTASFRSGVNQWKRYDVWPPVTGFDPARLYLEPGKKLSFTAPAPTDDAVAASYVSNPADPVPYRHRPIQSTYAKGSEWYTWLVEDQRFVTGRKDVASFTMPALDQRRDDHRRGYGRPVRRDHRKRRGLDRQADRCLSRQRLNECGLSTHGRGGDLPGPLSAELQTGSSAETRRSE
jgi:putative CocE/NonD family hydrolase